MIEDIFEEMRRMKKEMDKLFEQFLVMPKVKFPEFREPLTDISEKNGKIIIKVDLPGVKKENISLTVSKDDIEIKAEAKKVLEKEGKGYYRRERSYKGFYRKIALPAKVIPEKTTADYSDGVLTITLTKEKEKKKKEKGIKIKVK